jgi:hypothetical protein
MVLRARKKVWPGHRSVPSIVAPGNGEHVEQIVPNLDVLQRQILT